LLAAEKIEAHVSNLWIRSAASKDHRPARRYLRSLSEIRRIQDYLIEQAGKVGVPVIETSQREEAIRSVIQLVLSRVEQHTLLRDRGEKSSLRDGLRRESGRGARKGPVGRA
jgi:2-phosphoglycerate kinase